ncbi:hypothetical protein S83_004928, partial [Arachis hypogaea]
KPDRSKHLETAMLNLFGMRIDFVNLRSEEYTENSRIPSKQSFGTPEVDAYRRDLTINSLFYNIHSDSVEDFTKRGISDLKSGRIVTPLPPKAIFLDDPLRVLRAIRFGVRFEFTLDEDLKVAAACGDVKDALAAKISKERIGKEIDLMISGNQPVKALTHICDLTLFWNVFSLPPKFEPAIPDGCESLVKYMEMYAKPNLMKRNRGFAFLTWILHGTLSIYSKESTFKDKERRLSLFAALFLPLKNITYQVKKAKMVPVVNYIIVDSLKRNEDAKMVLDLHQASQKFLSLIPCLASNEDLQPDDVDWIRGLIDDVSIASRVRVLTGFLLREIKDLWRVALLVSILLHPIGINDTEDESSQLHKRRDLFNTVESSIIKLGLDKVWEVKPLISGEDIKNVLQLEEGPLVKEWKEKSMAWELANPSRTTEECIDWLRETNSKRVKLE